MSGLPLTVRVVGANGVDRHIGHELRDLTYRSTAVGGFASATFALDRPIHRSAPELEVLNKIYVYDRRNAEIVWQGYLEEPGRAAGSDGLVWTVSALGPAARAQDQIAMPLYADTSLDNWMPDPVTAAYIKQSTESTPPRLSAQVPRGVTFVNGHEARWTYRAAADAAQMDLARVQAVWDTGVTDANISIRLRGAPSGNTWTSATANTAGGTLTASLGSGLTSGDDIVSLVMTRTASNLTPTNDDTWVSFASLVVRGRLYDKTSTVITSGYTTNTILASEVVADVLGRLLTVFDGANAVITATAYPIDKLVYFDGANAEQILADLMVLEPAYRWAAWGDTVAGKPAFEWVPWPTTVRYEADVSDGFSSPESSLDLYDSVMVRWRDAADAAQQTTVLGTVPALQGIPRRGLVDLGSVAGSSANAIQAGTQFLTEHATASNAGTLTVAHPIVDAVRGRMVWPHQIRPGALIRVHGISARQDSLNAAGSNGTTVFRVVATNYTASTGAVSLELDAYTPSLARSIANVIRRQTATRRR
jgi:hypothetical protein